MTPSIWTCIQSCFCFVVCLCFPFEEPFCSFLSISVVHQGAWLLMMVSDRPCAEWLMRLWVCLQDSTAPLSGGHPRGGRLACWDDAASGLKISFDGCREAKPTNPSHLLLISLTNSVFKQGLLRALMSVTDISTVFVQALIYNFKSHSLVGWAKPAVSPSLL